MNAPSRHLLGDEEQLFRELHPALLRRVTGALGGDREAAEDACATTWAIFLRRQPQRSPTLTGWLWVTARREAVRQRESPQGYDDAIGGRDPLDIILDAEDTTRLIGAIGSLPATQRQALVLLGLGMAYSEIASRMGRNCRQVDRYLSKGRAQLRQIEAQ